MTASDISIVKGENKTLELTVRDKDNNIVDITGHTLIFTVKLNTKETANLFQKTSGNPAEIDLVDPTNGRADIFIDPIDTSSSSILPGEYVYDIWTITPSSDEFAIIKTSEFKITERVR